jgi:hypothetical protein
VKGLSAQAARGEIHQSRSKKYMKGATMLTDEQLELVAAETCVPAPIVYIVSLDLAETLVEFSLADLIGEVAAALEKLPEEVQAAADDSFSPASGPRSQRGKRSSEKKRGTTASNRARRA